jgi:very-short-patch-repair endonuclease
VRAQTTVERTSSRAPAVGRALAALAGRQHGVISIAQLRAIGIDARAARRRVASGALHRLHPGVYAVGRADVSVKGRYQAAVLACGDGALISHHCAAALWGLRYPVAGAIDVTIQARGGRRRAGLDIHVARSLSSADISTCEGIPCTSVARTLVDVAATSSARMLDRMIEQSQILRIFDRTSLLAALDAAKGKCGVGLLRERIVDLADRPPPFRSELERRFYELVRDAGLPKPIVNGRVAGHEVDFHWPAQRLIVETDGGATHGTPSAFERDRQRDLELTIAGWRVSRLGWRQVTRERGQVLLLLRDRLAG